LTDADWTAIVVVMPRPQLTAPPQPLSRHPSEDERIALLGWGATARLALLRLSTGLSRRAEAHRGRSGVAAGAAIGLLAAISKSHGWW